MLWYYAQWWVWHSTPSEIYTNWVDQIRSQVLQCTHCNEGKDETIHSDVDIVFLLFVDIVVCGYLLFFCCFFNTGFGNSQCVLSLAPIGLNCMGGQCGAFTQWGKKVLLQRSGFVSLLRYYSLITTSSYESLWKSNSEKKSDRQSLVFSCIAAGGTEKNVWGVLSIEGRTNCCDGPAQTPTGKA